MCIRQLTSVATSVSAPLASMLAILRSSRLPETSLSFTANRPPKPQHVSASGSGQTRRAVDRLEQRQRLARDAQARAGRGRPGDT